MWSLEEGDTVATMWKQGGPAGEADISSVSASSDDSVHTDKNYGRDI